MTCDIYRWLYLLERAWRVVIKENWRANRKKNFYIELRGNAVSVERGVGKGGCGGLVKILLDSPCLTVRQKLLNTFGWIFYACLIGFYHRTAEIHLLRIQLINYRGVVQKVRHFCARSVTCSQCRNRCFSDGRK